MYSTTNFGAKSGLPLNEAATRLPWPVITNVTALPCCQLALVTTGVMTSAIFGVCCATSASPTAYHGAGAQSTLALFKRRSLILKAALVKA